EFNTSVEIINFSMGGYHLIQHVEQVNGNLVFQYQPDGLIYFAHTEDKRRLLRFVTDLIQNGTQLKYPFLIQLKKLSGAKQSMSRVEIEQRLKPHIGKIVKWSYAQIAKQASLNKTKHIWIFLPATADQFNIEEFNELKSYAMQYGFYVIDLVGIYDDIDVKTIQLSDWDSHPNEKGHQLIANKLFDEIIKHKKELKLN
ncbi:MAG: SGNH/GDSL hydrolase family protein, partial [Vicingaceae bacterium]|nr:SGNH/GDSL hydrolase family protein [Vicingaceae bacterium]